MTSTISFCALFPTTDPLMDVMIRGSLILYMFFRSAMAVACPKQKWTPFEYAEFMVNGDNQALRKWKEAAAIEKKDGTQKPKRPSRHSNAVDPSVMNSHYFKGVALQFSIHYGIYIFARAYFEKYPYEYEGMFVWPLDWEGAVPNVMLGILIYSQLSITSMWRIPASAILRIPHFPIFDAPYRATSLRDFWSHRWNLGIKTLFHTIAFKPTLKYLDSLHPSDSKTCIYDKNSHNHKHRSSHYCHHHSLNLRIASIVAFLASALYHEAVLIFFMPGQPHFVNGAFFLLHGVLCLLQLKLQKITGFGYSWGRGKMWDWVGWAATMWVLVTTSPLFARGYARSGLLMSVVVPEAALDFVKRYI
ncbi:hypothetical protein BDR26DRAFT_282162 [Obelidium mucronatum]|nr:hypothetical protein BDR26DRAFT_282162 [Obelidium mucronatum]